MIASSPLVRSILTAAHSLTTGSKRGLVLLPAARESDAHWFYGRDSLGTPVSHLPSQLAKLYPGGSVKLILDRVGGEVWWSTGEESEAEMAERLGSLLQDTVDLAPPPRTKTPGAVVLTTHSLIIRRLFKGLLDDQEGDDLGRALGQQSIQNCGVIAVDVVKKDGALRVTRPRLLFGTEFASFSPAI